MNCPNCNHRLNPADSNGNFCFCIHCRSHVPYPAARDEWRKKVKGIITDPTTSTLSDVQRMATELVEAWKK